MPKAHLQFHPLTFVEEPDGVLVGSLAAQSYAVLPADGAELLRRLMDGVSVDDAARWYGATFGEPIDMADFLATLHDLGFVKIAGAAGPTVAEPERIRWQALGRAAFSPVAWACYAGLVAACCLAMARHAELRPHPGGIFFVRSLIVVQVVLLLAQVPALLWHEWFHVLAGRRLGLPTRLSVTRRLYFVAFETHLDGLLGVPRRQRYLPFLAGMLADVVLFSALTLAATVAQGGLSWVGRLAIAIAYTTLLRLAWQFCVFLRTDLYYTLTTAVGSTDLAGATSAYLRSWIQPRNRLSWKAVTDGGAWSPRDAVIAPWFALVTVAGGGLLLWGAAVAVLPVAVLFTTRLVAGLTHGAVGGAVFWNSAAPLILTGFQLVVLPLLIGRYTRGRPSQSRTKGTLS